MDSEYVVIVDKAGEKFKYVTDEKRALTDDSKELEEKLGSSTEDGVKTVGGAGENVFKDKKKEEKYLEEVPAAEEEKADEEGAAENEAKEDSAEKLSASEDDVVKTVGGDAENVFKDEEKDSEDVLAAEEEKDDEEGAENDEAKGDSDESSEVV